MVVAFVGLLTLGTMVAVAAVTLGRRDVETSTPGTAESDAEVVVPRDAATPRPLAAADATAPPLVPDAQPRARPRPDAKTRAPVDAATVTIDAAAPTPRDARTPPIDASGWGSTINPFPDP
jgi:hypothetical protein